MQQRKNRLRTLLLKHRQKLIRLPKGTMMHKKRTKIRTLMVRSEDDVSPVGSTTHHDLTAIKKRLFNLL